MFTLPSYSSDGHTDGHFQQQHQMQQGDHLLHFQTHNYNHSLPECAKNQIKDW